MSQSFSREIVLLAQAAVTTSGTGADLVIPSGYSGAFIVVDAPTVSGTSPTLNVYIQEKLTRAAAADTVGGFPSGTAMYDDTMAATQLTTSGQKAVLRAFRGSSVGALNKDASLTAGTVANGPLGDRIRVKYVLAGTSPSFTFSVVAKLIP